MKLQEFNVLIAMSPLEPEGRTVKACRLVMVDGYSIKHAASSARVDQAAVSRALKKIPEKCPTRCPTCQQVL